MSVDYSLEKVLDENWMILCRLLALIDVIRHFTILRKKARRRLNHGIYTVKKREPKTRFELVTYRLRTFCPSL